MPIGVKGASAPGTRRLVFTLGAVQLLLGIGGSAIIPLLPTYLVAHGSTTAGVGLVMGSFFFAQLLGQYPAGWLVDRVGFRVVVIAGLVIFAVGCVGFAYVHDPLIGIGFRSLQGIGDGAVTVAGAAAIGVGVRPEDRGWAYTFFSASLMLSYAIGPIIGGLVGSSSISALFLGAGALAFIATGATRWLPAVAQGVVPIEGRGVPSSAGRPSMVNAALVGAALAFGATGILGGLYDGVWSLLLSSLGVSSLGIAFSWTLYCLPYVAFSPFAGRLLTHLDRRALACGSIASSAIFASIYPAIHHGSILVFFGAAEAFTAVFVTPAAQAILSEHVADDLQGRAQGIVGSVRTAAMAVGAYGSGALFGVRHALPFQAASVCLVMMAVGTAIAWRRVQGRSTVDLHAQSLGARPLA